MRLSLGKIGGAVPCLAGLCLFIVGCASPGGRTEGKMTASWYGEGFHGKPTASGRVYDQYQNTAAHKTLPFGTVLEVTNRKNGRRVHVTVNDRGPFVPGRDLDLSYAAARDLGMIRDGVEEVYVRTVGYDERYDLPQAAARATSPSIDGFFVQVASFSNEQNAIRFRDELAAQVSDPVVVHEAVVQGRRYHRVRIGPFQTQTKAQNIVRQLAHQGYQAKIFES